MVVPLYQLIPVFQYFLARIFLKEYLTGQQIFASLLIISGAVTISLDLTGRLRFKSTPFLLVLLSSFMIAINGLVFKIVALNGNFWGTAFWEYLGSALLGLLLFLFVESYRRQLVTVVKKNSGVVLSLSMSSEFLNLLAKLIMNFVSLLAPLALVGVINGFQPMFVLIYGLILTIFIPRWGRETLNAKIIVQRVCSIIVMLTGAYLLFR